MRWKRPAPKEKTRKTQLDNLQEDSWQLELIVSGVVIFLLLGAYDLIGEFSVSMMLLGLGESPVTSLSDNLLGFGMLSYLLLVGMFLLHLCVRGMWIGAIGLRSVSGGFDFDELTYRPKFVRFLRRRLGTYDDYIDRLERNASITFSLAFVLFFAVFSIGLFLSAVAGGIYLLLGAQESMTTGKDGFSLVQGVTVGAVLIWSLGMILVGLLYFIDFVTFGWLKKRPWFHKVYYPFYRFLGWVTLARLYRPLYYNIIDSRFGRRLVRVYLLLALLLVVGTTFNLTPFPHFSYAHSGPNVVSAGSYVDQIDPEDRPRALARRPSLGSRFAREDYLEVFAPNYTERHKDALAHRYPELKPLMPSSLSFLGRRIDWPENEERADSTLAALSSIHRLYLNDSLLTDVTWKFYDHPRREQPGLLYDLPVYDLPRGQYVLRVEDQDVRGDSLYWRTWTSLPFVR